METMITRATEVTIRAKAFSGEGVRTHRVLVDADTFLPMTKTVVHGLVRVWDRVAGHYTSCHTLTREAKKRARAAAAAADAENKIQRSIDSYRANLTR